MIKIAGAEKTYGETVVGPIDLDIPRSGITALIGPNGAGKSTLLTMIGRLLGMDQGAIEVAGLDVASADSKALAKVLSILRQENHFVTRLTVRQLVAFGRFPHTRGRLTTEDEAAISQTLDFLNLSELQHRYLDQLSGGQRQRAYVAMVLAQDTDYVLLDEPLNNLDIAHSVEMMRHLQQAAVDLGKTIIVVLHDINFAACYADRICAMRDGQIFAFGTPEEIVRDEILSNIFGTPITVIDGPHGPLAAYL